MKPLLISTLNKYIIYTNSNKTPQQEKKKDSYFDGTMKKKKSVSWHISDTMRSMLVMEP